jgi:hypothetical protein
MFASFVDELPLAAKEAVSTTYVLGSNRGCKEFIHHEAFSVRDK